MAITYPTSLDTFGTPDGSAPLGSSTASGRKHSDTHRDEGDAIEALEAKVGVDQSAVTSSHEYRLRGAPHSRATSSVASTTTGVQTVSVASNKVRSDCTARVRVSIGGFVVDPSRVSVNGARDTVTIAAETISGSTVPFIAGDSISVEYAGEGA